MSLQRSELYHFSAVDVFFELLKRRIGYYTKKVQVQSEPECELVSNGRSSVRVIRSKLRKREESSGVRSSGGHPEGLQGVLQAPVPDPKPCLSQAPPSLESIFISPASDTPLPVSPSDTSLSSCTSTESTLDSTYSVPMFLYSTANSRNSLNSSDQVSTYLCLNLSRYLGSYWSPWVSNRSSRKHAGPITTTGRVGSALYLNLVDGVVLGYRLARVKCRVE